MNTLRRNTIRPMDTDVDIRRPQGKPNALDRIVRTDDGIPVTVEEHIIERLSRNEFVHAACEGAGVETETYYGWIRAGAKAAGKKADGYALTALERRYIQFAENARHAIDEARSVVLGTIHGLAVGGLVQTRKTTRTRYLPAVDGDDVDTQSGTVVEVTVVEEALAPDLRAAAWIAERRYAKDWNRREQVEITGSEGGPVRVQSEIALLDQEIEGIARRQAGAIETCASEVTPDAE